MNRVAQRLRGLPLRSRLALLVATAVAVAVAVAASVCWFVVQSALVNSLDDALKGTARLPPDVVTRLIDPDGNCRRVVLNPDDPGLFKQVIQIVDRDGNSCVIYGKQSVEVTPADVEVANGKASDATHVATAGNGSKYRVYTYPLTDYRAAVSVARPLSEVDDTLGKLGLILALVAGIGVVGAGAAGLWVARTGLRPVDELTDTVEHVARTEDLTVRIPVEGDDEIARLSASFNSMTASLASSRDLQQQLIADAGHELRTPLTSMRTNIELLTRSEETGRAIPPDDRKALMASLKAQMTELAALIGDLQVLSRTGLAGGDGPLKVVSLHDTVRTAIERARLRGPELTITSDLAPWYVRAEPAALERAIVNLLDNAVKFSPPEGTLEVHLMRGRLTVRDHGPGIPADELPYVFDRFWRSPTARALPGSGLGLSIVARTVESYGGTVGLGAAEGGGTVATVQLPGAPTPPPEVPEEAAGPA
ncbi:ATP-binding protein [Streptomyces sp. NPDC056949]|uniref:HAMP domain-containing sensor histidine kinase n=1 Tax=Streptomyces sp. NPDC056949 TaxID=3345976 RepID=UPI0036286415